MNRRLFRTRNGYLGIGSFDLQSGDELHILSGARTPFVLCRTETPTFHKSDTASDTEEADPDMQSYIMVGEAYVLGLMHGQALKISNLEWNGIYIL